MMTVATGCACPGHGCRATALPGVGYCASCLAGWHNATCGPHTAATVNPRLSAVDVVALGLCGRCGARLGPAT
jgi:hypothetical protein